mgnify:CR=1 FL=1
MSIYYPYVFYKMQLNTEHEVEKVGIKIPLMGNTATLRISFYGLPLMKVLFI